MRCRVFSVLIVLTLSACATTGGPSGSGSTWPTYSYTYSSDGVQYIYQYPYGPVRVVTPSTWPKPAAPYKAETTPPPAAPQDPPPTRK